jgi:hypothetical protein
MTNNKQKTGVKWLVEQLNEKIDFIPLDKWDMIRDIINQAKEMEKQQIIEFAEFLCTYPDKNRNVYGDMLHAKSKYDSSYTTKEVFKEFINNHYGK